MTVHCPACKKALEPSKGGEARATMVCPHCGRVVVVGDAVRGGGGEDPAGDPGTSPLLEPLARSEGPTEIGVASQTLSLPPGQRVSVVVLSGPRKGDRISLDRPRVTFGRADAGAATDVQVSDPDVSRNHAALECHGTRIVLRDLGSRNGTFIGEERVTQREVQDRTEFRLGATTFLLLVTDL